MQIDPRTLEGLPRNQLIERARRAGVRRPELLTRVELKDEIVRLSETDERKRRAARGWFGVARDLLASMVEQGLHMPDAAKLIRGEPLLGDTYRGQTPVATVTLAEIYVAQGHTQRALKILDEVLAREPDHEAARELRGRLMAELERAKPSSPVVAPPPAAARATPSEPAPSGPPSEEAASAGAASSGPAPAHAAPAGAASSGPASAEAVPAEATPSGPASAEAAPAEPAPAEEAVQGAVHEEPAEVPAEPAHGAPAASPEARSPAAADVVVTIAEAPDHVYLYWEVSERSLSRARRRQPDGHAAIRLHEVRPDWEGARHSERELEIEVPSGSRSVSMDAGALLRAALGWRSAGGFVPFAVGSELTLPGGNGAEPSLSPSERRALERFRAVVK